MLFSLVSEIFLQRVSIACYTQRCIRPSYDLFLPACLSVTIRYHVKMTQATIMWSSLKYSPLTLVSSWLPSVRNSKENIGSGGAESERAVKFWSGRVLGPLLAYYY